MKNVWTLLVAVTALSFSAQAQNPIPNANFEDWTTSANGRDSLIGWSSSNAVAIYPVKPLVHDTNAFQGDYSAELITAPFGFVQYTKVSILVNGEATFNWTSGTNGYSVTMESGGGTPIDFKPTALNGFYKCETFAPTSQGWGQVLLTKYNPTLQKRDTVAYGTFDFIPAAAYTAFSIPINDLMVGTTPDSITTIFYSSNPAQVPTNGAWSNLYLDSLSLEKPLSPPVANFEADSTVGTTNTVVHLFDSSTNNPTSWQWTFVPNTVTYQSGTSAMTQNPIVKFDAAGDYSVTLIAANQDGSDTFTRSDYIHISQAPNGIAEHFSPDINMFFPNPARRTLHLNSFCLGAACRVVDLQGRALIQLDKVATDQLDVSGLPNGVYFLNISKNGVDYRAKFVIRR